MPWIEVPVAPSSTTMSCASRLRRISIRSLVLDISTLGPVKASEVELLDYPTIAGVANLRDSPARGSQARLVSCNEHGQALLMDPVWRPRLSGGRRRRWYWHGCAITTH